MNLAIPASGGSKAIVSAANTKKWLDGAAACFDFVLEDGNFKWYDTDGMFLDKNRYVPNRACAGC